MTTYTPSLKNSSRSADSTFPAHQVLARRLHDLGPGMLAEFLAETVDHDDLRLQLPRYERIDPSDPCRPGAARYNGPRPLAEITAKVVIDARLRRKARALYDRPPRLTVEAILALVGLHGDTETAERVLDNILAVPDDVLAAFDALDVPPSPIHVVQR